jgi:hypothetical protein
VKSAGSANMKLGTIFIKKGMVLTKKKIEKCMVLGACLDSAHGNHAKTLVSQITGGQMMRWRCCCLGPA